MVSPSDCSIGISLGQANFTSLILQPSFVNNFCKIPHSAAPSAI